MYKTVEVLYYTNMNYDQQVEKMYAPENFEVPCGKCEGYAEDHDDDGRCLGFDDFDTFMIELAKLGEMAKQLQRSAKECAEVWRSIKI